MVATRCVCEMAAFLLAQHCSVQYPDSRQLTKSAFGPLPQNPCLIAAHMRWTSSGCIHLSCFLLQPFFAPALAAFRPLCDSPWQTPLAECAGPAPHHTPPVAVVATRACCSCVPCRAINCYISYVFGFPHLPLSTGPCCQPSTSIHTCHVAGPGVANRERLNQLRALLLLVPFGVLLDLSATLVLWFLRLFTSPVSAASAGPRTTMVGLVEEEDVDFYTDVLPQCVHALSLGCCNPCLCILIFPCRSPSPTLYCQAECCHPRRLLAPRPLSFVGVTCVAICTIASACSSKL